ncbi:MAG: hypothetical protein Kow0059_17160 [Candidatus Sumerlaeia bacterium]
MEPPEQTASAAAPTPTPEAALTPNPVPPTTPSEDATAEQHVPEMRYLPQDASVPAGPAHPMLASTPQGTGLHRLTGAQRLTSRDQHGEFIAPRWSPDGLQILASRPGFDGVWLIPAGGGEPVLVADGNGYNARWTTDGKIEITDEDGRIRRFTTEGVLETIEEPSEEPPPVYSENDTIWVKPAEGGSPFPLTGGDDRYFNPVLSPDGRYIVYQGLQTGLYVVRADGSGQPVYIGRGNNPVWLPDSSGILFDVTADDGHNLIEGDIYFADVDGRERTNLTEGDGVISERPSVSPDGRRVSYEANGDLYVSVFE